MTAKIVSRLRGTLVYDPLSKVADEMERAALEIALLRQANKVQAEEILELRGQVSRLVGKAERSREDGSAVEPNGETPETLVCGTAPPSGPSH